MNCKARTAARRQKQAINKLLRMCSGCWTTRTEVRVLPNGQVERIVRYRDTGEIYEYSITWPDVTFGRGSVRMRPSYFSCRGPVSA